MFNDRLALRQLVLVCGLGVTLATAAAPSGLQAEARLRYGDDMAVCDSGHSNQDATVCRKEARAALAEADHDRPRQTDADYKSNALRRCDAFASSERSDCEARMRGEGKVEGSVAGGGLLRESTSIVPEK